MSKHEDPFLNYFFVPLYAADTKCSFMSMTLLSAMTMGNNFHFIPYFRVLLATNVGTPLVWFWSPFLCQKSKNPNQQQQQQKKKVFWFFQCCLGWQKTPGFSQCLGLFLYNGEGIFFFGLNMVMLEPEDRSLTCSPLCSNDTEILTCDYPSGKVVAGKRVFCKIIFCLRKGVWFWFWWCVGCCTWNSTPWKVWWPKRVGSGAFCIWSG